MCIFPVPDTDLDGAKEASTLLEKLMINHMMLREKVKDLQGSILTPWKCLYPCRVYLLRF